MGPRGGQMRAEDLAEADVDAGVDPAYFIPSAEGKAVLAVVFEVVEDQTSLDWIEATLLISQV